jgi:signal transduction histidine kinase
VIRFKSIISRIVILHVVAVVITSIFMSLALSWLLNYATNNIHNEAMQEQAVSVGEHLTARSDGVLELDLPREVRPLVTAINLALDRLEQGFRIQRDFIADPAHELRTPLTILRTRLDILEAEPIGQALRKDVDGMAHIISQLLEIAELDAFVIDPLEKADLRSVTAEVAEFVAPLALAQAKDVALLGTTDPVWVRGNPEMLSRAIRNLAENAINHTAPATTVEFIVEPDGTVSVLDHGPGIAEDERHLIFQRFWRRDRSKPGSTGLGLSIVARIAELHSAEITVQNRRPAGAKFSLKFVPLKSSS